ncbi:MAG: hypothetical protein ACJAYJ_001524 [Saprospiraceae bacterium]|jgi:hypothetical protein
MKNVEKILSIGRGNSLLETHVAQVLVENFELAGL